MTTRYMIVLSAISLPCYGRTVSVGSEEGNSQFLHEARAYFSNVTLLRALWVAVDRQHNGVITLEQLRTFLNSSQRDTCVALLQSPLNTPFLASKSCLREAYLTCTQREVENLNSAEIFENEFPLYIRHLFLYMQLYAVLRCCGMIMTGPNMLNLSPNR